MSRSIQLSQELSDFDRKAFEEAKLLVRRLEQTYPQNPNKVAAEIAKATPEIPEKKMLASKDTLFKMRVAEIAREYQKVSDGHGGIATDAHKIGIERLTNVLEGKAPSGGFTLSQRVAIAFDKVDFLATSVREALGKRNLLVGGAMTITAGFAAAAEPGASPQSVVNAMIDSSPVAGEVRRGRLCGAFGQAVGGVAAAGAGAATGLAINGLAGGATALTGGAAAPVTVPVMVASAGMVTTAAVTTHGAVAPVAENACNFVANKFGM